MEEEDEEKRETGGRGKGPTLEKIGAHVARYNITLLARTSISPFSALFHMQNHRRRPIVAHCGITSLRSSLPHLVYFPPSSSRPLPLFRLLSHPSAPLLAPPLSHFPYRSAKPVVLCYTTPTTLPPPLPRLLCLLFYFLDFCFR